MMELWGSLSGGEPAVGQDLFFEDVAVLTINQGNAYWACCIFPVRSESRMWAHSLEHQLSLSMILSKVPRNTFDVVSVELCKGVLCISG